jgi:hypothetical protein
VRRRSPFPVGTLVEVNACDEKPVWVEAKVSELLLRAGLQMKFDQISFINEATLQIRGDIRVLTISIFPSLVTILPMLQMIKSKNMNCENRQ